MKQDRPVWMRLLLWLGAAFLILNVAWLFVPLLPSAGGTGRLLVVAATLAVPLWGWHLKNVVRTWGNKPVGVFSRRDDPQTGGHIFDVKPARAARMPAIILFAIGLLLLLTFMAGASFWIYVLSLVFIGVGCTYVVPGARYRRPVTISVSPQGIRSDDLAIPLQAVADLRVGHNGLVIDPDTPMPGPNGVPIATMAGRAMGRRQSQRGFAVEIRRDGEGHYTPLAGGLTPDCATALVADIKKATAELTQTISA